MTALVPWEQRRRAVLRNAMGVGVAVGTYGISFGALATTSGLSVAQTCALSVLAFTGGSQFALVGVLGAGGSALSGTLTALLLGSRNTLYGLRLAPVLHIRGLRRAVAAQLVIDESTAMAIGQDDDESARLAFWSTGFAVFTLWNLATLLGAVGATALGDPKKFGLDAAVGAAFLGLLWPRLKGRVPWLTALVAAVTALVVTPSSPRVSPSWWPASSRSPSCSVRHGGAMIWAAVLATSVGCYLLKIAGLSVPERVLASPRVRTAALLLPIALLAALTAVQTFGRGQHLASTRGPPGWPSPSSPCCCVPRSWSSSSVPPASPPRSGRSAEARLPMAKRPPKYRFWPEKPAGPVETRTSRRAGCGPTGRDFLRVATSLLRLATLGLVLQVSLLTTFRPATTGDTLVRLTVTVVLLVVLGTVFSRCYLSGVWVTDQRVRVLLLLSTRAWSWGEIAYVRSAAGPTRLLGHAAGGPRPRCRPGAARRLRRRHAGLGPLPRLPRPA